LTLGARVGVPSSEETTRGRFGNVVIVWGVLGAGVGSLGVCSARVSWLSSSLICPYAFSCLTVISFFVVRFRGVGL
jgi:hypothetical protein